jgi:hypothetical protein
MSEWVRTVRGALLFDTAFYHEFSQRNDVFLRGVIIVLLVALVASIPAFVINFANGLRGSAATPAEPNEISAGFDQALRQLQPALQNLSPDVREMVVAQIRQGFVMAVDLGTRIQRLPTILPRPIGGGLRAIGAWLSVPFGGSFIPLAVATLGAWLGYGLWAMLAAKILGGRSDLAGFLGTTSLYAVPHLLNVFSVVPVLNTIVWLVAFAWGLAIFVKATAISHEMSLERAVLAVFLPVLFLAAAAIVLLLLLAALIGLAMGSQ